MDASALRERGRHSLEIRDIPILQVDADVAPHDTLLIPDSPFQLGTAPSQLAECLSDGVGAHRDHPLPLSGGPQHRGQVQGGGHATIAARTASTSGRWLATSCQESPSSKLAYTSPSRVPK